MALTQEDKAEIIEIVKGEVAVRLAPVKRRLRSLQITVDLLVERAGLTDDVRRSRTGALRGRDDRLPARPGNATRGRGGQRR
jgi:hypothetical protein